MAKATYLGQCDKLRVTEKGEYNWQQMVNLANKKQVSTLMFPTICDITPLLAEEETPTDFIANLVQEDPDTVCYKSFWGHQICYYLQSSGFEFIFI